MMPTSGLIVDVIWFVITTSVEWRVKLLRLQGELALAGGDQVRAEQCYRKAVSVAQSQEAKSWELRATMRSNTNP